MNNSFKIVPGNHIGRYEIIEIIGEGGFARVYLAKDPELGRHVALKIDRNIRSNPDFVSPLLNEARILADLQHPSILTVFDIGRHDDQVYLVFEYMPGSLERELWQTSTSLPQERVVDVITKVADVLDFVHRRGYLHRNVKPRIVLLDATGEPRLSGFEVAVQQEWMVSNKIAGTPPYMAPEQLDGDLAKLGPNTDIWGLGVTMYQALTRVLPFQGRSLSELRYAITNTNPTPLRKIVTSIPQPLEQICLKCLSREPTQRYPTANLLAADLREWRRGIGTRKQERVFISHSSNDRDFVEQEIIAFLEKNGIATWYSKVDIQSAVEWERSILQGLQSTQWFLLVMSPRAASSEWVKDELHWAIDNRPQRIIPILIDDCDPRQFHIRIARLQYIDFRSDLDESRRRLLGIFQKSATAATE